MNSQEGEPMAAACQAMPSTESSEMLSQLFAEHHRRILLAACRITGSMADAEDVAQAVFLRLASGKVLPIANAGSYLYRAAINGALDLLRRQIAAQAVLGRRHLGRAGPELEGGRLRPMLAPGSEGEQQEQ